MKRIIDISEEDYNYMMECCPDLSDLMNIYEQLKNSTPLNEVDVEDCISRAEAINAINGFSAIETALNLKELPRVQPTRSTQMIYEVRNIKTNEVVSFESDKQVAGTRLNFLLITKNWNIKDCEVKEQPTRISDNTTNGDMIMAIFPNVKTWVVDKDMAVEFPEMLTIRLFPLAWWNAPYKENRDGSNI